MTPQFQVGEIAVYVYPRSEYFGQDVEIMLVGPIPAGKLVCVDGKVNRCKSDSDYVIRASDGAMAFVDAASLRKKRPPEEAGLTRLKADIEDWLRTRKPVVA